MRDMRDKRQWWRAVWRSSGDNPAPAARQHGAQRRAGGLQWSELVAACRERAIASGAWAERERLAEVVRDELSRCLPAGSPLPVQPVLDAMVGYGPLGPLLADPAVSEVMVVGPAAVYVERDGRLEPTAVRFANEADLLALMSRLVSQSGRRLDVASPCMDARLPDGTRLHAVLPPLSVNGPALTLRKLPDGGLSLADLVHGGTLSLEMADFLRLCVAAGANLLISGPCGSGKTTTLRALAACIDCGERVVSIEDAAELSLTGHVVALQCRPADLEGRGTVGLRELLRNALRMRPDRLIVGEVRGAEALDLVHAMGVGHACMSTLHASGAQDALGRLEGLALLAAEGIPLRAVRDQITRAVEVVVHQERLPGGIRVITAISSVQRQPEGPVATPVFWWESGAQFQRQSKVRLPAALWQKLLRSGRLLPDWLTAAAPGQAMVS